MNSFLKKVKGLFCGNSTPVHETLENFVNQQVQSLFSSPKTTETFLYEQVFSKFPLQLEETKKIIINELKRVFGEKTTDRQKINLRKLTLETSKSYILNTLYRSRVEADRRIINEKVIFVGDPFETLEAFALISVVSSEIELLVYRNAQDLFFSDAKPNDYFSIFQEAYRINTNLIFDGVIAEKKGDVFAMQPVLKASTDFLEKIEQDALAGKDLIYENVAE